MIKSKAVWLALVMLSVFIQEQKGVLADSLH